MRLRLCCEFFSPILFYAPPISWCIYSCVVVSDNFFLYLFIGRSFSFPFVSFFFLYLVYVKNGYKRDRTRIDTWLNNLIFLFINACECIDFREHSHNRIYVQFIAIRAFLYCCRKYQNICIKYIAYMRSYSRTQKKIINIFTLLFRNLICFFYAWMSVRSFV